jgi:hypothetical protein
MGCTPAVNVAVKCMFVQAVSVLDQRSLQLVWSQSVVHESVPLTGWRGRVARAAEALARAAAARAAASEGGGKRGRRQRGRRQGTNTVRGDVGTRSGITSGNATRISSDAPPSPFVRSPSVWCVRAMKYAGPSRSSRVAKLFAAAWYGVPFRSSCVAKLFAGAWYGVPFRSPCVAKQLAGALRGAPSAKTRGVRVSP